MLKTLSDHVWAFDAEWVPDPRAGRLLYGLPADQPDAEVVAEMWRRGGATEQDPFPFLRTVLCRVVSIAAVQRRVRNGKAELKLLWLPRDVADPGQNAETAVVGTFLQAVGKHRPQLVGFNCVNSDLRILSQRAVVLGIQAKEFCARPNKPWEGPDYFDGRSEAAVVDLMDLLSGWGKSSALSLNEIATLSGIPGKFRAEGEQVAHLWLAGKWKEIVQYNCFDALSTYLLWLRVAAFGGHLTREQYAEEQETLRQLLMELADQPDGEYLTGYFDEWERLREATGQE